MDKYTNKHIETAELVDTINNCIDCINKLEDSELINYYPLAFINIFVKFQNVVYLLFEKYCVGQPSSAGYLPELLHNFNDEIELRKFLGNKNKDYIDYDDRIRELADFIFRPNVFENLFYLSPVSYTNLKYIRNYIAHESDSSKNKVVQAGIIRENEVLGTYFLKRNSRGKINFNEIVHNLYEYCSYLIEGPEN